MFLVFDTFILMFWVYITEIKVYIRRSYFLNKVIFILARNMQTFFGKPSSSCCFAFYFTESGVNFGRTLCIVHFGIYLNVN